MLYTLFYYLRVREESRVRAFQSSTDSVGDIESGDVLYCWDLSSSVKKMAPLLAFWMVKVKYVSM